MINVGIIGLGYWGEKLLRVFNNNCRVIFASSHNEEKVNLKTEYPNVIFKVRQYENLIKKSIVDAVVIATPTKHHKNIIKICAKYKKHVFVEKPLASSLKDCYDIKTFFPSNRILFVGHIFLYHSCYIKLINHVGKENISSVYASWNKLGKFNNDFLLEILPHDVSLGMDIFNKKPIKINKLFSSNTTSEVDHFIIDLEYSVNQKYTIELNRASNLKRRFMRIVTKDGKTFIWENNEILLFNKNTNEFELFFNSDEEPLNNEIQYFLNCIKENFNKFDVSFSSDVISIINDIKNHIC